MKLVACKQGCGLQVSWVRQGRRVQCLNPDGSVHWDLCSQERFKRLKAEGTPFERKAYASVERGLSHAELGDKLYAIDGTSVRGANYVPSCGECSVPPWELCACSPKLGVAHG